MACGITKIENGVTVTCDNAGTSAHAGNHSGLVPNTYNFFGRVWTTGTSRVYWKAAATTIIKQKVATLGESDFV